MKPATFSYVRPSSLPEALDALAAGGETARPLAGGQSLAPMMNMRLLRPAVLVDLNRVEGLDRIDAAGGGTVIGAMTRYSTIERSPMVAERLPLLQEVVAHIGDRQVRNRGTIGGSLAQADPTGEMLLAGLALNAQVVLRTADASRTVALDDFVEGAYETVLEPGELIVEVRFPPGASACGFAEVGRKHNDFAIASVAVTGSANPQGRWSRLRIAINGLDDRPVLATTSAALLEGTTLDERSIEAAVDAALAVSDPADDVRASADYREAIAASLLRQVLAELRDGRSDLNV